MFDELDWGADETQKKIDSIKFKKLIGRTFYISAFCMLIGFILWIAGSTAMMQKDTLDTLNLQQQEINDLRTDVHDMGLLYQNGEKEAPRGEYERTGTYLGEFNITYYCGCEKCCDKTDKITKLGTTATVGRTVGTDWNVLQPGTKIYIEGIGERVVEDTGGSIQGNHIDVYVDSHEEALNLGRATRKVYEVE